jgi:hypothetical protein
MFNNFHFKKSFGKTNISSIILHSKTFYRRMGGKTTVLRSKKTMEDNGGFFNFGKSLYVRAGVESFGKTNISSIILHSQNPHTHHPPHNTCGGAV